MTDVRTAGHAGTSVRRLSVCSARFCVNGGRVKRCDQLRRRGPCTTDTCDPAVGCVYTRMSPATTATPAPPTPATRPRAASTRCHLRRRDVCTTDTCDPAVGCVHDGRRLRRRQRLHHRHLRPAVGCVTRRCDCSASRTSATPGSASPHGSCQAVPTPGGPWSPLACRHLFRYRNLRPDCGPDGSTCAVAADCCGGACTNGSLPTASVVQPAYHRSWRTDTGAARPARPNARRHACVQTFTVVLTGAQPGRTSRRGHRPGEPGRPSDPPLRGDLHDSGNGTAYVQYPINAGPCPGTVDNEIVPQGGSFTDHRYSQ